jgi:hypothetical protein
MCEKNSLRRARDHLLCSNKLFNLREIIDNANQRLKQELMQVCKQARLR